MSMTFSDQVYNFIEKYNKSLSTITSLENEIPIPPELIRNAALNYFNFSLLLELQKTPIEELARSQKGIHVKVLQNAGYKTIAQVHSASVESLSSIRGISQNSAKTIKRETNRIVKEIENNISVCISPDEKNQLKKDAASMLIIHVSQYRQHKICLKKLQGIKPIFQVKLKDLNKSIDILDYACELFRDFGHEKTLNSKEELAHEYITKAIKRGYGEILDEIVQIKQDLDNSKKADFAWDNFSKNPIEFINILEGIDSKVFSESDANQELPEYLVKQIKNQNINQNGLLCQLRPYQIFGVKYILHQENVLLGDEMGLGKTVQAIATMVSLKNTGATHFLVVCPASVLANWSREIHKMSNLNTTVLHGLDAISAFRAWQENGDVAITTFGMLDKILAFSILRNKFSLLVVDEAHYVKNPRTDRTINVKSLCHYANRILFMTGTPLENNVGEMCNLIRMLQPGIASSIEKLSSIPSALAFRNMIAPVYYRRKRNDVLKELPALTESNEWCIMNSNEERVYEQTIFGKNFMEIRRVSWNADDLHESCKAIRMKEIIEEAKADGRKTIIFSFFLGTMSRIKSFLEKDTFCTPILSGAVSPNGRQKIIDDFEKAPAGAVLLSQIEAGGTGLNIQSASVVIICEPQLKPSTESQAISRVYRMGQTRKVLVYRLLCEGTIDERLTEILDKKQKIFNAFADKSVAAQETNVNLSKQVIDNLISEEIDRINRKHRK